MTVRDDVPDLGIDEITRRYLRMLGLRWLATGLLMPILVLVFTSRGLALVDYGLMVTAMTAVTFLLELPTGGLADALGRRRMLVVADGFWLVSYAALFLVAVSPGRPAPWLLVVFAGSTGIHRALESGPADAWFVDAVHTIDADATAPIDSGLGRAGRIAGVGIALGSVAASGLLAVEPVAGVEPMAVVVVASAALAVVHATVVWRTMVEVRPAVGLAAVRSSIADVPRVIGSSLRLLVERRTLRWLMVVEATVAIGMISYEQQYPVRMSLLVGDADDAAIVLGLTGAVGWLGFGLAAGLTPWMTRRFGGFRAGMAIRAGQAVTIVGMAVAGGPIALAVAFTITYTVFGMTNPVHLSLVHAQVGASQRATVLSLHSMVGFAGYSSMVAVMGALSDHWSPSVAMMACAAVVAAGVGAYRRAERWSRSDVVGSGAMAEPVEVDDLSPVD